MNDWTFSLGRLKLISQSLPRSYYLFISIAKEILKLCYLHYLVPHILGMDSIE